VSGLAPDERLIEADSVRALYAQTVRATYPPAAGGAVMVMALWETSEPAAILCWYALVLANCAARILLHRRFQREPAGGRQPRVWGQRFAWTTTASGALFGSLAVFFFPQYDLIRQLFILFTIGIASTAAAAVAYYRPASIGFLGGLSVPVAWRFAAQGDGGDLFVFVGMLFMLAILANYGLGQARMLRELIVTRRMNLDLIEELSRKNETAEAAQSKAEQASLAKSRFFAAASHDLRQPLQALGLHAASLKEMRRDPEDKRRLDRILSGIDALESLFDELLDISKLDAGSVQPQSAHFPAQRIFERLEATFRPLARRSGLDLAFAGGDRILKSDPVLLERVLGNLVSNALRYTESGGVVVSCQPREGGLAMVVEDTGIGIPPGEHERVFDEFYQLGNPGRDRRKGLGLGLATVKRITDLLGYRMTMTSAAGAGTTFLIDVPAGDAAQVASSPRVPTDAEVDTLAGRNIVVIEDDAAVRDGLVQLLGDWKCCVTAASSAAEALAALDAFPEAIIADYRLRDGETGVAAIAALRERLGAALPAVLVTGDTAPEIFSLAQELRLPLLTKPVRAARLRAALTSLLGEKTTGAPAAAQA
jgi:signal transduction histidine kinase/ActR/RegA family two-component response regulator